MSFDKILDLTAGVYFNFYTGIILGCSASLEGLPSVGSSICRECRGLAFWTHAVVCIFPGSVGDGRSKIFLGSSVHRPMPDAERQTSLVGLHSINTGVSVPLCCGYCGIPQHGGREAVSPTLVGSVTLCSG